MEFRQVRVGHDARRTLEERSGSCGISKILRWTADWWFRMLPDPNSLPLYTTSYARPRTAAGSESNRCASSGWGRTKGWWLVVSDPSLAVSNTGKSVTHSQACSVARGSSAAAAAATRVTAKADAQWHAYAREPDDASIPAKANKASPSSNPSDCT